VNFIATPEAGFAGEGFEPALPASCEGVLAGRFVSQTREGGFHVPDLSPGVITAIRSFSYMPAKVRLSTSAADFTGQRQTMSSTATKGVRIIAPNRSAVPTHRLTSVCDIIIEWEEGNIVV
jgi:hypothetical protein